MPPPSDAAPGGSAADRAAHARACAGCTSWRTASEAAAVAAHPRQLRMDTAEADPGEAALSSILQPLPRRPEDRPSPPRAAHPTRAAAHHPRQREGPAWATALIVFSGAGHDLDLAARLRERGVSVEALDTKDGGTAHDVFRDRLGERLVARARRGDFDVIFLATPCASYSVAHRPQLRSRRLPLGVDRVPQRWRRFLEKHNRLADLSADIIRAATASGTAWAIENPADRGDETSPAWWKRHADHAPIWRSPSVRDAIADGGGVIRTFAQCSFAAHVQKWTSVAHSPCMSADLAPLDGMPCRHGRVRHSEQAHGRYADGTSRASAAAAYPPAMNEFLAEALAARARRTYDDSSVAGQLGGLAAAADEGRVADGHALGPLAAAACEAARWTAPRFASLRNRLPAALSDLRHEPMPGEPQRPPPLPSRPWLGGDGRRARSAATAAPHVVADADVAAARRAAAAARAARMLEGPVAIEELYLDGVYEAEISTWMHLANAAAAALREGRSYTRPPSRTITQAQMQPWARDVVWDCADRCDCRPVARSTRHTQFPGARQLDRDALRRVARDLAWHDGDIVDQAGEGGIEVRSHCALDTVLSFHHAGLNVALAAAAKAVSNDLSEEWVDQPARHLPFVPCRVLPRNVVMQERSRLVHDGGGGAPTLELYLKARVTQDSSDGGDHAVNAGVPAGERYVTLPTVQQHARGLAICDTAGGDAARAASYVVDAESAYRFCPVQRADQWTQCFFWWDADGLCGVCVDRRLGFGGAFAPNRFERISTLVAAHIQSRQALFDASQAALPEVLRWTAERRSIQAAGGIPRGEGQLAPRYLQVYIDDFSGCALCDAVGAVTGADDIIIDPQQVVSEGGVPATLGTRVYAHAQIAIMGLRDVGLSAAPGKVVAGDPVVALGLRVSRADRRVDCPPLKRASMLADIAAQRSDAVERRRVRRKPAERAVGRLCNLSQVFPALKSVLHGGYAVSQATWDVGGRRRRLPDLPLSRDSTAYAEWLGLLDVARDLLTTNDGVELAPARAFPSRTAPGSLTIVTDASGVDGFGGYAFDPAEPSTVWLVSEKWEPDIQRALDAAAAEGPHSGKHEWGLSMPAAELFGIVAVAAAVAAARGVQPTAIFAVGDCDAAASAVNATTSGKPQMRRLLCELGSPIWLAVSLPREANVDADRLSHPAMLAEVRADAAAAGIVAHVATTLAEQMVALRAAAALGVGR